MGERPEIHVTWFRIRDAARNWTRWPRHRAFQESPDEKLLSVLSSIQGTVETGGNGGAGTDADLYESRNQKAFQPRRVRGIRGKLSGSGHHFLEHRIAMAQRHALTGRSAIESNALRAGNARVWEHRPVPRAPRK